ncbi:protein Mpv17-like isoform X1 [Limulus polyphemus]|uniref:Mitochondrial inner membrane protein Mpv17 n=2 Tax=Limulus polyphemus TaxID=6850 RepID=A0ABM1B702_LIMPO|nr:protein Mpv17-like isoform X1 [Limulus polyphemus]
MATSCLRWYLRVLDKHPWKTQTITTGILMACGDFICQTVVEQKTLKNIETRRLVRFAFLGTCFVGPTLRSWYLVLEKVCGVSGKTVGLQKMLLDQGLFVPVFLANFLTVNGLLQNHSWIQIKEKLKRDYFEVLKANYMLWPAAQLFNFYIVPFQHRVMVVNLVALFWNTYLAWKANTNNVD